MTIQVYTRTDSRAPLAQSRCRAEARKSRRAGAVSEFLDVTLPLVSHTEAGNAECRGKSTRSAEDGEKSSSFREVSETIKKPEMGGGRGRGVSCAKRERVLVPGVRRRHDEATRIASDHLRDRRAWRSIERDRNVRSIKACLACLNARCTRRSLLFGLIRSDVRRLSVSPKPARGDTRRHPAHSDL